MSEYGVTRFAEREREITNLQGHLREDTQFLSELQELAGTEAR